ncbi:hypothetical protein V7S43_009486 [Phytophthora oleae]|uniref:Glycine-rich protein n=1 Tax=Phytophthora oleae TaxID=2107226 RepID=A0ABD3FIQ9_9STRA
MKIAALAVVAAIAVANVAAADQPALRTAATPVEAATAVKKPVDGNNKKEWGWGGPWGGYGWGGGYGGGWGGGWGGCCGGLGGWGGWGGW